MEVISKHIESSESSVLENASTEVGNTNETPVSKNQLKKRRREEHLRNKKIEKKLAEKQRKLEARLAPPSSTEDVENKEHVHKRSCRNKDVREHYLSSYEKSFAVIIDCNWESIHKEGALKSLANQMSYCYGANRRHSHPCKMYVTGLGPRLGEKVTKMNIENWKGVTVYKEEYTEIASEFSKTKCDSSDTEGKQPKQLVYLTADSDHLIDTLDPSCAYIIGGIVDRNSAKGQTLAKAKAQGVVTARLPIRESVSLNSSQVLTVNHVFEILLNFAQSGNWTEAIEKVLPKRKAGVSEGETGEAVKEAAAAAAAAADDDDDDDDVNDDGDDADSETAAATL